MMFRKSLRTSTWPPRWSKASSKAMALAPAMPAAVFFQYRPRRLTLPFSFPSKPWTTSLRPTRTRLRPPVKNFSRAAANSLCRASMVSRWGKQTP